MSYITANDVRNRLRITDSTIDVTDAMLTSAAMIPAGDAWIDKILSLNGTGFASLSATDQALVKAAEIAFVAHKVVNSAPRRGSKTGPITIKPVPSQDKKALADELQREWELYFNALGYSLVSVSVSSVGSSDYMPDGEDLTNIDFSDTENDFSEWA